MVLMAKAAVALTVLAFRLPPGAPVVSKRTRVDPANCGPGEVEMVGVTLLVDEREAETVPLLLLVEEEVADLVLLSVEELVGLEVGVSLSEDPEENVLLCVGEGEGVGDGEASTMPCTKMGELYTVPALVTEFHTRVGKLPAVVPVRTSLNCSKP